MAELVVARYPRGAGPGTRLELSGSVPYREGRLVPFVIDWLGLNGEILLHFNARPDDGVVVLNSFTRAAWGDEVAVEPYPFDSQHDLPFRLSFHVLPDRFRIAVDDRGLSDFEHRAPPSLVREVRSTPFLWRLESARDGRILRRRRGPGRAVAPEVVVAGVDSPRNWSTGWITTEENPREPELLESFRLFAVLGTWMEEDIVEACVKNAFAQGCDGVFLVDNFSPDSTAERALDAGAVLARRYSTDRFSEEERMREMQAVVDEVSREVADDHVWWLFLDADEFYHGPRGLTLRQYLATLDRRFRVVGGRFFNHIPVGKPAYVEGRHPLDFQPLCYEVLLPYCDCGHWRHPLQRWDRGAAPITPTLSFHMARSSEQLREPTVPVFFHHFPYRAEEATRRRLRELFRPDPAGGERRAEADRWDPVVRHMSLRARVVDAVYSEDWERLVFFPPCAPGYSPLRAWEEWVDEADAHVQRWY